ncbi:MAG: pseudaminic acid synthase [Desulfobacteraceae bacterium]|nr:pseudaminic acid synthase [Desulfobacteraceae bacterium]
MKINQKKIAPGSSPYIIAEMSANHNQCYETAVKILEAAKEAGADAVKLQTYTPETLTIKSQAPYFTIKDTIWKGQQLFDLYQQAQTPWEWQPKLKQKADSLELDLFSSPFDASAIDFLESLKMPAYKIASFELTDLELLKKAAQTGKPIILSTGMASIAEIDEAVKTLKTSGCNELALLKCTSAYPADPEDANLTTIPYLTQLFKVPVGLSDHTVGGALPIAGVALGACIIEKHFCLNKKEAGPDASFSMEPHEFKQMVKDIHTAHKALGKICFELSDKEKQSIIFRRSLFAIKDIRAKEKFTPDNISSIRPGYGLHPRYLNHILNKKAQRDIPRGTPLSWDVLL